MSSDTVRIASRAELDPRYTWRLEDLFPSREAWEAEFAAVGNLEEEITAYRGRLGESAQTLFDALACADQINERLSRVVAYAIMRQDEENTNAAYQALRRRAVQLATRLEAAQSYIIPEILAIPDEQLDMFLAAHEPLRVYKRFLDTVRRRRPHILSEAEEALLARMGELARTPSNVFDLLNNADLDFPTVRDEDGQEVQLSHGRFIELMKRKDRRVRKDAYEAYYNTYRKVDNTMAALLSAALEKDAFFASVRRYESSLHMALDPDRIPIAVYDNLLATVRSHLPLLHRYIRLRKRALGLDELHMYDLYAPLVPEAKFRLSYEEAKDLLLRALAPLGEEYIRILREGFESRWIDVYESAGKTSGAYSFGVYGSHPFVLLNWQESLDDAFTLAHEMGHALHSYLTNQTQPFIYSDYSIFVAEVASTVNEVLLMHHLLDTTDEPQRRMYILNHYLEQFRGTVFRQTLFAEFEKIVHERTERGEPLTPESANHLYGTLLREYLGDDMVVDSLIEREWSRIPHFYTPFYVYQYATGFSAAVALGHRILTEGEPAVRQYLNFLRAGSSDDPLPLLRAAGVDMTTPGPIHSAMSVFAKLLDEMENLLSIREQIGYN